MAHGAVIVAAPDVRLHGHHHRPALPGLDTWVAATSEVARGGLVVASPDAELATLALPSPGAVFVTTGMATTTTSTANVEWVKALGADVVIDYKQQAFEAVLRDYDVVLNSLGADALAKSLKILKPGGQLISISGPPTPAFARAQNLPWVLGLVMGVLSSGIRRKARKQGVSYDFVFMRASGAQLDEITALVESGIIRPVIDRTFPFESTAAALDYVEQGRAKGKVVITMATAPSDAHPAG